MAKAMSYGESCCDLILSPLCGSVAHSDGPLFLYVVCVCIIMTATLTVEREQKYKGKLQDIGKNEEFLL
jgi:hypothetical protein